MTKRKITNFYAVQFKPFDNYGSPVEGMSWHKISYNKENGGQGSYLLKMDRVLLRQTRQTHPYLHVKLFEFNLLLICG